MDPTEPRRGQFPPTTSEELADWLLLQIDDLQHEAEEVYKFAVAQPPQPRGLFVQTLYAYVGRTFSLLDRLALHCFPDERDQTLRMVDALDQRAGIGREAGSVAVHVWRHGLLHTGEARKAVAASGQIYRWLLHWGPNELPDDHNWTFSVDPRGENILNLSLARLIADLRKAIASYATEVDSSSPLRAQAESGFRLLERKDQVRLL